jgi:hypothetical protein
MRKFDSILENLLKEHNGSLLEGVQYENYRIAEKNSFYYIFANNKIIGSAKTFREAKERCDTINSGC